MACINRKLWGLLSCPTLFATRADMGTAETPAAPIKGFTLLSLNLFIIFAITTPEAVPKLNAIAPRTRIPKVSGRKNACALSLEPTDRPKKMVTIFINSFCEVLLKRSTTPHSRIKLPMQNMPIKGAADGNSAAVRISNTSGKTIFSCLPTWRNCAISINRSSGVVKARMMGGCINGTKAM